MGRGDSRSTSKMRRLKAQNKLKQRITRRRAAERAERAQHKAAAAPPAPAASPAKTVREKK